MSEFPALLIGTFVVASLKLHAFPPLVIKYFICVSIPGLELHSPGQDINCIFIACIYTCHPAIPHNHIPQLAVILDTLELTEFCTCSVSLIS